MDKTKQKGIWTVASPLSLQPLLMTKSKVVLCILWLHFLMSLMSPMPQCLSWFVIARIYEGVLASAYTNDKMLRGLWSLWWVTWSVKGMKKHSWFSQSWCTVRHDWSGSFEEHAVPDGMWQWWCSRATVRSKLKHVPVLGTKVFCESNVENYILCRKQLIWVHKKFTGGSKSGKHCYIQSVLCPKILSIVCLWNSFVVVISDICFVRSNRRRCNHNRE